MEGVARKCKKHYVDYGGCECKSEEQVPLNDKKTKQRPLNDHFAPTESLLLALKFLQISDNFFLLVVVT